MLKWKASGTILFSFLIVVFCSLPEKLVMAVEKIDETKLAMEGGELTKKEAMKLEEKLREKGTLLTKLNKFETKRPGLDLYSDSAVSP